MMRKKLGILTLFVLSSWLEKIISGQTNGLSKYKNKYVLLDRKKAEILEHAIIAVTCKSTVNCGRSETTYIPEYTTLVDVHKQKVEELQEKARNIAKEAWNPFKGLGWFGNWFGSITTWLGKVGHILILIMLLLGGGLILWKIGWLIFSRCTKAKPATNLLTQGNTNYASIQAAVEEEYIKMNEIIPSQLENNSYDVPEPEVMPELSISETPLAGNREDISFE